MYTTHYVNCMRNNIQAWIEFAEYIELEELYPVVTAGNVDGSPEAIIKSILWNKYYQNPAEARKFVTMLLLLSRLGVEHVDVAVEAFFDGKYKSSYSVNRED